MRKCYLVKESNELVAAEIEEVKEAEEVIDEIEEMVEKLIEEVLEEDVEEVNEVVICKYCRKKEYYFSMRWLNGKELCRSCYKKEYEDFTGDLYEWNDLDGFRPK